jgi:phosphotransferase system HPr (HPr) family protein
MMDVGGELGDYENFSCVAHYGQHIFDPRRPEALRLAGMRPQSPMVFYGLQLDGTDMESVRERLRASCSLLGPLFAGEVEVTNRTGMHMRSWGHFVKAANDYGKDVRVFLPGRDPSGSTAKNGKSIMELLTLGATRGTRLRIYRQPGSDGWEGVYDGLVRAAEKEIGD